MKVLKRLKRLWAVTNPDLDLKVDGHTTIVYLPENAQFISTGLKQHAQVHGNGKAVFLSDMTEEEFETYQHEEKRGWKKFYNRVFGRNQAEV